MMNDNDNVSATAQDWQTEVYKGFDVHVSALLRDDGSRKWDYTVRVSEQGVDSSAESELVAGSGDDADYESKEKAVEAAFVRGYAMVDKMI